MKTKFSRLYIPAVLLCCVNAGAQNIRNDTIFVSTDAVVELKFPDRTTRGDLPDGDRSYEVEGLGRKSFKVKSLKKSAAPQRLIVTEGPRKHRFVLVYADKVPALVVDWSNKRRLEEYVRQKQQAANKELENANHLYSQGSMDALEKALAKYNWLLREVEESKEEFVQTRIADTEKQLEVTRQQKFTEAMARVNRLSADKKYQEALDAVREALTYKPGEATALRKEKEVRQILFNEHIAKAKTETKEKDHKNAKEQYERARDYDKESFQRHVTDYVFVLKKVGEIAMAVGEWNDARPVYETVLSLKPDDRDARVKLNKIDEELAKRADYYSILSRAKSLADKASSERDFDIAIEEYQKAGRLFANRQFPKDRIAELKRKKNTASARN